MREKELLIEVIWVSILYGVSYEGNALEAYNYTNTRVTSIASQRYLLMVRDPLWHTWTNNSDVYPYLCPSPAPAYAHPKSRPILIYTIYERFNIALLCIILLFVNITFAALGIRNELVTPLAEREVLPTEDI